MADRYENKVRSVTKGLIIIEVLADAPGGLTLQELSLQLEMNKTTVYRLLTSLMEREYVEQDPVSGKYCLGTKVLQLSASFFRSNNIHTILHRQVALLFPGAPYNIYLSRLINNRLVIIDYVQNYAHGHSSLHIGKEIPFHCTAMGKVYLVYSHEISAVNRMAGAKLLPYTSRTITSPEALKRDLKLVSIQSFALDVGEYVEDMSSIGVPVFDSSKEITAALGVTFGRDTLTDREKSDIVLKMLALAEKVSNLLGYYDRGYMSPPQ